LLIAFILHHDGILSRPLLYLSLYFKRHRDTYYRLLDRVRTEGDWEAWTDFFLEGVRDTAGNAVDTARRLIALFDADQQKIQTLGRSASSTLRVFQAFKARPLLTVGRISEHTGLSFPAANQAVARLAELGIVREITGRRRERAYAYDQYVAILNEGAEE
jgi:Fic family protein